MDYGDIDEAIEDFADLQEDNDVEPALGESSEDDYQHGPPGLGDDSDASCDENHVIRVHEQGSQSDTTATPTSPRASPLDANVIPPWDAFLSDDQVKEWTEAEAKLGIKRSVKSWLAAKRKKLARLTAVLPPPLP